jgi:Spy/CpxP family protein refolding chaperone
MGENEIVNESRPGPVSPPPKRMRWLTVLLMLVLFVSGVVLGSGATALLLVRRVRQAVQHPEERPGRNLKWIASRLDLTRDQREQVREIIQRHGDAMQRIREGVMPEVREEMGSMEEEIAAVLTPEQTRRWREMSLRAQRDWMPPMEGWRGGEGPRQGQGQGQGGRRRQGLPPPEDRPRRRFNDAPPPE